MPSWAPSLLTPEGEEVSWSPPSDPHPDGRAPHQFHMDLRDLGDAQLWQLMEDLWQEVVHRELNVSPRGPPLGSWRTPTGGRDPNVEDEEVTFPGGGMGPSASHYCIACRPPMYRGECWPSPQYPCHPD